MEEIIKTLKNGLGVESLELSLPYLEPFNLLVDYESELEFSSPHSHRDLERRLAQKDPQKKLLTQLRKNPTELEKELRNLVLKLYSAGESDIDGITEKTTTKFSDFSDSNLTVEDTPSAFLTKDNQTGLNSQQSDLNSGSSSVAWSVGKQDATSTLTFIPPHTDGSKDCKAVTLDCDLNGSVNEAGFRIEQKSANPAHHEDKSLTSDPIQTSKKEKLVLFVESESNSKPCADKVLDVVQTHADKVHTNKKQPNFTKVSERSEEFNYALHSGSFETGNREFDLSHLEFRGDKEASVTNDLESQTSLKSNSTESFYSRGASAALPVVPNDIKTSKTKQPIDGTTIDSPVDCRPSALEPLAEKLPLDIQVISNLDHKQNKAKESNSNNNSFVVCKENCMLSVNHKDNGITLIDPVLHLESTDCVKLENVLHKPHTNVGNDSKYHHSQSWLTQTPTSQVVNQGSSFKSPEKVTVTSLESENSKQDVKLGEANLLPTQVSVSQNTSRPGGTRQSAQFHEGVLSLSRNKPDSCSTRTCSLSDFPLTPEFDDSGIRLEFGTADTERSAPFGFVEEDERLFNAMAEEKHVAVNGGAAETETQCDATKKEHSNLNSVEKLKDLSSKPVTESSTVSQVDDYADEETDSSLHTNVSNCNVELFPLYFSTPQKSIDAEQVSGMIYQHEANQNKELKYQNANLEGKLEALQKEYFNVLDQRKMLHSRLQNVEDRLKFELQKAKNNSEKENRTSEDAVNELEKARSALESQVTELLQVHHEKEADLTEMQEKLAFSKQLCQNLQENVSYLENELADKDNVISALKLEIEKMRKDLVAAQKQNEELNKKQKQLTSDVTSLISVKERLEKQLSVTQDARLKLQIELTDQEAILANQNKLIEQVKCERARTSRQLMETQQKAMEGKSEILQNLEKVEEEMLQRESAMKQLEVEKDQTEKLLAVEVDSLRKENKKLQKLASSSLELENELKALKIGIEAKEASLKKVECDKELFEEQLKEAQQVNTNNKYHIISLNAEQHNLKKNLEITNTSLISKEEEIKTLVKEKEELERCLKLANEEKIAFDNAVQALKVDLGKVDRRFKLMQRELVGKKGELEKVQGLEKSFKQDLEVLKRDLDRQESISNELREELKRKDESIVHVLSEKRNQEVAVSSIKNKLESLEKETKAMEREKQSLQQQLLSMRRNLSGFEDKLQTSLKEKARLEGLLEATQINAKEEIDALTLQNSALKQEVISIQQSSQNEISLCKSREATLERQLEQHSDELSDKLDKHNFEYKCIEQELQQVKESKEETEKELQRLHKVTELSVRELKKKYEGQCSQLRSELDSMLEERNRLMHEQEDFKEQSLIRQEKQVEYCCSLQQELETTKEALNQNKHEIEQMHMMAIELEREKGRLAGVMASQSALRQHSVKLEETVAQREAEVAELTADLGRQRKEREMQEIAQKKRTATLESNLKSQRDNSQLLQSNLNMEKRENAKLRVQLQEKSNEMERLEKELKAALREVKELEEMYNRARGETKLHQNNLESVKQELDQSRIMCEVIQRELSDFTEQKQIKDEQMSSLDWEVNQRSREVEYLKDQMRMSEERQQIEIENMKTAVQVAKTEVASLRSELVDAKKTKTSYQQEVLKLKDELLVSRQETDLVKEELFKKYQEWKNVKDAVARGADLNEIKEELLAKVTEDSYEDQIDGKIEQLKSTSTLSNGVSQSSSTGLGLCMQTLRSQIASLQKQMNEHTDYIQVATLSWRSFQENVKKLQEVKYNLPKRETVVMTAEKDY